MKDFQSSSEVLKKFAEKKSERLQQLLGEKVSPTNLKHVFAYLMASKYDQKMLDVTWTEVGMLKQWIRRFPTPEEARGAFVRAVQGWEAFTEKVKQERGLATAPSKPRIDFLLTNAQYASNFEAVKDVAKGVQSGTFAEKMKKALDEDGCA